MTASAVCSVTDTPPTLLVCVNRTNRSHGKFVRNGTLCVNVLGGQHRDLSGRFAASDVENRFDTDSWDARTTGAPVLSDSIAAFDCLITAREEVGTHSVFFCEVQDIALSEGETSGLIWFERKFHDLRAAS